LQETEKFISDFRVAWAQVDETTEELMPAGIPTDPSLLSGDQWYTGACLRSAFFFLTQRILAADHKKKKTNVRFL